MQKIHKELGYLMKENNIKYRLEKTEMQDEDVNLDVEYIKVNRIRLFSVLQSYIYQFLDDYRSMLIAEENKPEVVSSQFNPPFSLTGATPMLGIGNCNSTPISNGQIDKDYSMRNIASTGSLGNMNFNQINSKLLTSEYDAIEYKTRSYSNTSNGTQKQSYINSPYDDQYDQKVEEIVKFIKVCRDKKFEVKEESLIHMLNYIFYYRPLNKQQNVDLLTEAAECFESYVANLIISELSNFEKCEDSRYAHLLSQGLSQQDGNKQNFKNNTTNNLQNQDSLIENNGKQTTAFDFIQQETIWEYICFYARYTYNKKNNNSTNNNNNKVNIDMLLKFVFSYLQLCFYKFKTQEYTKIRRSTLDLLEKTFLNQYLKEEIMKINQFIFLRYLLLSQFRNVGFVQELLNRVTDVYKIQIVFFIEKIYSMYCDDYPQSIIRYLKQCWWRISDKDMKSELFERVLTSTQSHIFTREDRNSFINQVKSELPISNDDDIFYPCISNEDYCVLFSQKEIEDRINQTIRSKVVKQENQIIQYQYYMIKFILNNQNEQLFEKIFKSFRDQNDINKRTIGMIFNEMKQENASYCLKLLYIIYRRIFRKNEWQDQKYNLFLSYPNLLMKHLDKQEEQIAIQKIRNSHFTKATTTNYSKRNDDESGNRQYSSSSNSRFRKNNYQIQTKFRDYQILNAQPDINSCSKFNPASQAQLIQQKKILFLLRLGYTIIDQKNQIIDDSKFNSLFTSTSVHQFIPFETGNISNAQYLFFNEFFHMILKIIEKYKMNDNNKIMMLEMSKILGYLSQIGENAFLIKEYTLLLQKIKQYDEDEIVQNNLIDIIISMSLENGEIYYKLVEDNFIKESDNNFLNTQKLRFNIDNYERKYGNVKNIRIKIPSAFQLILKLINNKCLIKETTLIFLCFMKSICKLEYNQVILQCCINTILKIIRQSLEPTIQKLLFSILELLTLHMNVTTLSKIMKFFRPVDKKQLLNDKDYTDEDISSSFTFIPQVAKQNISSIYSDNKTGIDYETSIENLKNNYLDILSLLKKLCNRNLQSAYTNNTCYLDLANSSFIQASNLGAFSNENFSFIITLRLHEFNDNIQESQQQYILKLDSNNGQSEQYSLEILIEKSNRDNNYGICIRTREQDISSKQKSNSNQESSIISEDTSIKQQDYFKVDLESNKWYLLGICYTNKPPNNNYQAGRFYIFLNGNHVFYSGTTKFDLQKLKSIDNFYLGNDEKQERGLKGQISNFFLSNSFMEGKDLFQMFQFYQEGRISNYPNFFDTTFVLQLNINAFQNKDLTYRSDVINGLECLEKENIDSGGFFSKLMGNTQKKKTRQTKFATVKSGGNVFFIQKMTLVEACLQVGNIDIFLFIIQLVAKNSDLTSKQSNEIVADIFILLSEFYLRYREYLETLEKQRLENFNSQKCEKFMDFNDDLKIFLQDDGFRIISKLLYDFITMKSCDIPLVQSIIRFIETLKPEIELFQQGTHEVIMNMELWCLTNQKIQEKVIEWVLLNFKQNSSIKKYLIDKEYFQKLFLFQNSMMFHSEITDEQKYMRNRLNEIILILINQSEAEKSGENFKRQIEIFYQFFIFTMYDKKLEKLRNERLSEFLEMFERILKSPKLSKENLNHLSYLQINQNSENSNSSKGVIDVSIISIWQTILSQINNSKTFDYSLNQLNQQIVTKILKNLKRLLETKEKLQANIKNSRGQIESFYVDLEKIMIDLSKMLFCTEYRNSETFKINYNYKSHFSSASIKQQSSDKQKYISPHRNSGRQSNRYSSQNQDFNDSYNIFDCRDEKDTQEQLFIELLSTCINYDQPTMKLSLLLKIMDNNLDRIDDRSREKFISLYISRSDTPNMLKSILFYPEYVKFLTKLNHLEIPQFNQISAKYLAYKLSYELDNFLNELLFPYSYSELNIILRFLDEGLKIIFKQIDAERYGAFIRQEGDENTEERMIFCIFKFIQFLEDLLILRSDVVMKPYSTSVAKRDSGYFNNNINNSSKGQRSNIKQGDLEVDYQQRLNEMNNYPKEIKLFKVEEQTFNSPDNQMFSHNYFQTQNMPNQANFSQSPQNYISPTMQGNQQSPEQQQQEEQYLQTQQNSALLLSIFNQCYEYLYDNQVIYSTLPQILKCKEKIKIVNNETQILYGIIGTKNVNNQDSKISKGQQITNKINVALNIGKSKQYNRKSTSLKAEVKIGGLMRAIPNFLFYYMKKCQFYEDFILALKILENFIMEIKPRSEKIGEQNVNFILNRLIKYPLCVQQGEDVMLNNIQTYLFCCFLHLFRNLRKNLSKHKNTSTNNGSAWYKSYNNSIQGTQINDQTPTPTAEYLTTIPEINSMVSSQQFNKLGLNTFPSQTSNQDKTPISQSYFSQKPSIDSLQHFPYSRGFSCDQDGEEKVSRGTNSQVPRQSLELIPEAQFENQLNKININCANEHDLLSNIQSVGGNGVEELSDHEFGLTVPIKKRESVFYQSFGCNGSTSQNGNGLTGDLERRKSDIQLFSPNILRKKSDSLVSSNLEASQNQQKTPANQDFLSQQGDINILQESFSPQMQQTSGIRKRSSNKTDGDDQNQKMSKSKLSDEQSTDEHNYFQEKQTIPNSENHLESEILSKQKSATFNLLKQSSKDFDRNQQQSSYKDKLMQSSSQSLEQTSMCFSPYLKMNSREYEKQVNTSKELHIQLKNQQNTQDSFCKQQTSTSNPMNSVTPNMRNNQNDYSFNNLMRSKSISVEGQDSEQFQNHQGKLSLQKQQLQHFQQPQGNISILPQRLNLGFSVSSQDNTHYNQTTQNTPRLQTLASSSELPSQFGQGSHISHPQELNQVDDLIDKEIEQIKPLFQVLLLFREFVIDNGSLILKKFKQSVLDYQHIHDSNSQHNQPRNQSQQKGQSIYSDISNSEGSQQNLMLYQIEEKPKQSKLGEKLHKIEYCINFQIKSSNKHSTHHTPHPSLIQNGLNKTLDVSNGQSEQDQIFNEEYLLFYRSLENLNQICKDLSSNKTFKTINQIYNVFRNDNLLSNNKFLEVFHCNSYYQIKLVQRILEFQYEQAPSNRTTPKNSNFKTSQDLVPVLNGATSDCLAQIKFNHKQETWLQNKAATKWDTTQKNMISEKGIWFSREKTNGEIFFKLRRYYDKYGRRFLIGIDKSKEDGFYTLSPSKRGKKLNQEQSIHITSLERLDQQSVQQYVQRKSIQPSKYQTTQDQPDQIENSQNSSKLSDNEEELQYNNAQKNLTDQLYFSPDTNYNPVQNIINQSQNSSQFRESNQSGQSPSQLIKQNFIRRMPYYQADLDSNNLTLQKERSNSQKSLQTTDDSTIQQQKPFQRSDRRKCNTVAQTDLKVHQESYRKYLQQKFDPTQEQIEQSEITPKRPNQIKVEDNDIKPKRYNSNQVNEALQKQENQKFKCEYITLKCAIYGTLTINEEYLQFVSVENQQRPTEHVYTLYGSDINSLVSKKLKKKFQIIDIQSIHSRRFNMKEIAIEIFTENSKSYYFNFYRSQFQQTFFFKISELIQSLITKANNHHLNTYGSAFYNQNGNSQNGINDHLRNSSSNESNPNLSNHYQNNNKNNNSSSSSSQHNSHQSSHQQNHILHEQNRLNQIAHKLNKIELIQNRAEYFKSKKYTEKWKKGEISNFEYLMLVNQFASRSFNDITQYPIFPWIFNRYNNQDLDLNKAEHYRNLAEPVGSLNKTRLSFFQERYESLNDNSLCPPYFYSSHYSSQAFVYNYLIRLEPFTKLHFDFQSKKFDCPQRLFYSIPNTWFSCIDNQNDLRELIPEFFYLPEFLKSKPYLQLGSLPNGKSVNTVELPNWANNPEHFIAIHRKGLESIHVSRNLGKWIDLIFGVKQRSIDDNNMFPDCCYQDHIFSRTQNDPVQQIIQMNMSVLVGQCPSQIFYQLHEQRNVQTDEDLYLSHLTLKIEELEGPFKNRTIIGFNQIGKNIYIYDTSNQIFSIRTNEMMRNFNRKIFKNKTIQNEYEFKERGISTNYVMQNIIYSFNEQIMLVAGFQDCSFRVYKDLQQIDKIHYHKKPISWIKGSTEFGLVFCASEDLRISVWDIKENCSYKVKHLFYIYGHNQQITTICLSDVQKTIFSTDKDRICLIHSYKGQFLSNFILRQLEQTDYAILSRFSPDSSQILIATHENRIQLYNLNGELLLNCFQNAPTFNNIVQMDFFFDTCIMLCTVQGNLNILFDYHKYISNKHERINDQQIFKNIIPSSRDPITSFINLSDKSDYDILCITKNGIFKALKKQIQISSL